MAGELLRPVRPGDAISAAQHTAMVQQLRALGRVPGAGWFLNGRGQLVTRPRPRRRRLRYAEVGAVYQADGTTAWSDISDGMQVLCTASPCQVDGSGVDSGTTLRLKVNDGADAEAGLFVAAGQVVAYVPVRHETLPGATPPIDGVVVAAAGGDGDADGDGGASVMPRGRLATDATDDALHFLIEKLLAGSGISIAAVTDGGVRKARISTAAGGADATGYDNVKATETVAAVALAGGDTAANEADSGRIYEQGTEGAAKEMLPVSTRWVPNEGPSGTPVANSSLALRGVLAANIYNYAGTGQRLLGIDGGAWTFIELGNDGDPLPTGQVVSYGDNEELFFDELILIEDSTNTTVTLDSSDWRGRTIDAFVAYHNGDVSSTNSATILTIVQDGQSMCGASATGTTLLGVDFGFSSGMEVSIVIDGNDGGKLKMIVDDTMGSGGGTVRVTYRGYADKSAADRTVT